MLLIWGGRQLWGCRSMVSRAMSHHGRGDHPCHLCDDPTLLEDSVLDHILTVHHQELHLRMNNSDSFSTSDLLGMLENLNVEILPKFKNIFRTWTQIYVYLCCL